VTENYVTHDAAKYGKRWGRAFELLALLSHPLKVISLRAGWSLGLTASCFAVYSSTRRQKNHA